ncbi:MAG: EAL domain-containing protein [Gammaproteobacteria bacterium]|nr:MAG: EAL domain-containing protein [Gammaproteobacteria bacterium]
MTPEKRTVTAREIKRLREEKRRADAALRTREGQLANALRMAQLGYWDYDVATDTFRFNDFMYALLRTTAAREGGYTMSSARYAERFLPLNDQAHVAQEIQLALETDDPDFSRQLEHGVIFGDGTTGYLAIRVFVEKDSQNRTIMTHGVNQDITARKQAEENLQLKLEQQSAITHFSAYALRNQDADAVMRLAVELCVHTLGVEFCHLLEYPEGSAGELLHRAGAGWLSDSIGPAGMPAGRDTLVAFALLAGGPVVIADLEAEVRFEVPALLRNHDVVSGACLVIGSWEHPLGLLGVYSRQPRAFALKDLDFLQALANVLAGALLRLRTEERVTRLNRVRRMMSAINTLIVHVQDPQELLQEACRIAVEEGEFRLAWAGLLAPGDTALRPQFGAGRDEGFLAHVLVPLAADAPGGMSVSSLALRTRKLAVLNHPDKFGHDVPWREESRARGLRSIAALPIVAEDRLAGVLVLYSETAGFFDDDEVQLLEELGGDISFAMQNIHKDKALAYLASYDALTGLANGTLFNEHLNSVLERARHNNRQVGLLVCDLRQFRNINSVYGRRHGDRILQEAALRLHELTSDPVNIARIASDYFAMILHDVGDATGAAYMLENVFFPAMNRPYVLDGQTILAPCGGGVAVFPNDGADAETLYRNAEAALRKAKRLNEPYLFYQPEMTARIAETMQIEHKLRRALKEEQFVLHYQPRIETRSGRIVGVEALIRWNDPENGLVPPGKFIPILEESGMILEVGQWALEQAARDYRHWRRKCKTAPRIAVNVSAIQLRQNNFVTVVEKAIRKGGKPVPMDIEITESLIMTDVEQNIVKLRALQAAGIDIAVDDFGTGYSSLSYVAKLPINSLKIDRSFIDDMLKEADGLTIVSTIIALAHSLRLQVVAEGVETEEQSKLLQSMRCDEMQGFLFSRPVPADAILALIRGGGQLGIGGRG